VKRKKLLLGIDVGTTNVKAADLDCEGKILGFSLNNLDIINKKPNWFEQDSRQWWQAAVKSIKEALSSIPFSPNEISGIAVSGQGTAAAPVDSRGEPLRNALIWMDRRSQDQCDELSEYRDKAFEISGNEIDPVYNSLKILWIKENEPDIYKAAHKFLTTTEYINCRLTGNFASNDSDGGNLVSYNMKERNWSEELSEIYGIPISKLPDLHECTDIIGKVTKEASKQTGLIEGTPVAAGGEDTSSAALALGVKDVVQAYMSKGTSTNIGVCIDEPLGVRNIMTLPHVIKGLGLLNGNISTTGRCLQ
jgi:xylulokinase